LASANGVQATDIQDLIVLATDEIDDTLVDITEHANPDPFTMTVNTCATLGATGDLGAELMGGLEIGANGNMGVVVGGTGLKSKLDLQGLAMAKLEVLGGVSIVH